MNKPRRRESRIASKWYPVEAHTSVAIYATGGEPIFIRRHNNLNRLSNLQHVRHVVALHNAWLADRPPTPPAASALDQP